MLLKHSLLSDRLLTLNSLSLKYFKITKSTFKLFSLTSGKIQKLVTLKRVTPCNTRASSAPGSPMSFAIQCKFPRKKRSEPELPTFSRLRYIILSCFVISPNSRLVSRRASDVCPLKGYGKGLKVKLYCFKDSTLFINLWNVSKPSIFCKHNQSYFIH